MEAIVKFNIILNNDAIIKEYIISIREILKKCIMYIEKARVMYYNYKVKINTNITTENKKRKPELLNIDSESVSESVSEFVSEFVSESVSEFVSVSAPVPVPVSVSEDNLKTKKAKKSLNNEKVITWLAKNSTS
jgi:hypothetical protein